VAEVVQVGAYLRGRILHKELAGLEWQLQLPKTLQLEAGEFVRGAAHPTERGVLVVQQKIPPEQAATAAAIANHALPEEFSAAEFKAARALPAFQFYPTEGREDWRTLPFITIDGEDARDFDDAVWAHPWHDGHHVRVAIADVAFYVAEGSVLDKAAQERGNSTYFPNRVLPMLPERLSNDLCSLNPQTDKPVLAAELWLSPAGELKHYHICRAVIHSAKRCTYTEVQAHLVGKKSLPNALHETVTHLHAAFQSLLQQREARGAISLELPELKLDLDTQGRVIGATPRPRLAAHMLIEELMIAANVAAATALSTGCADTRPGVPRRHHPQKGVYRVHAHPTKEKLETLRSVLTPLGFTAPPPNSRPAAWAALATRVQSHTAAQTLQRALLQAQMQAKYEVENIGHFGLALNLYTHFTSPIRRYADLLVHRALLQMIEGKKTESPKLEATCAAINITERRSQQAEWEARDRMLAGWLTTQVGQTFQATITNIAPFGCFLSLGDTGAEALLPKWYLEDYQFIGGQNIFRKVRGGKGLLRTGSQLTVKFLQADFAVGRLTVGLPHTAPEHRLTARPKRR
jgi:ribonuclease R